MSEPRDEMPHVDKPLNGPRRPRVSPILAVIGLIVAIAVVFAVITLLRYHT